MTRDDGDATGGVPAEKRRLVLNPVSGGGRQTARARSLAPEYGFSIAETERSGHAIELARQAVADDVDLLAACGGDGTVHEVVQGLVAADALDSVTLCVVPTGTANIFATRLGIDDVAGGFEIAEGGETRRLDVGIADGEPFVMSAIAGLPADASAEASYDLKRRVGTLAFVIEGIREAREFDDLRVEIHATTGRDELAWTGEALALSLGNLRRFAKGGGQADAEDGLLEVAIVEQMPPTDAVAEAIEQRLFHQDTPHVREFEAVRIDVAGLEGEPVTFSLDGEIRTYERVQLGVWPRALRVRVGDAYVPHPGRESP